MKAEELDRLFDEGKEDVLEYFDLSTAKRPALEKTKIDLDLPQWMIIALDKEAQRLGIESQSLIKVWIAQHLDSVKV